MSAVRLSYHRRKQKNKFVKYCQLTGFLEKKEDLSRHLIEFKKNSYSTKFYKTLPNFQVDALRLVNRQYFSRRFIKRKLRRSRYKRRRTFGYICLQKTTNNLFISLHTKKGLLLYSSSICALGNKGKKERFGLNSFRRAAEKLAAKLHGFGLHRINVHVRCFLTKGFRNLIWSLGYHKVRIYQIFNFVKVPHGFMSLPARRRMKRRKGR